MRFRPTRRAGLAALLAAPIATFVIVGNTTASGVRPGGVLPGGLLDVSTWNQGPLGIAPEAPVTEIRPADPIPASSNAQMDGDWSLEPEEAEFHILNGPRQSEHFTGLHYSGSIHHSSYQEQPPDPVLRIWHHYEWGPNMSLYHNP